MVGKAKKARHQPQHKGNDTAVYHKGRLQIANLGPCPHAYASHLFLITHMTLKTYIYSVANLYLATIPSPLGPTREREIFP